MSERIESLTLSSGSIVALSEYDGGAGARSGEKTWRENYFAGPSRDSRFAISTGPSPHQLAADGE
jgi:hypothetical protein